MATLVPSQRYIAALLTITKDESHTHTHTHTSVSGQTDKQNVASSRMLLGHERKEILAHAT